MVQNKDGFGLLVKQVKGTHFFSDDIAGQKAEVNLPIKNQGKNVKLNIQAKLRRCTLEKYTLEIKG